MKLTIDIVKFFKNERFAFKNKIDENEFKEIVGEAVYRAASKLFELREDNESIAIDGTIETELISDISARDAGNEA